MNAARKGGKAGTKLSLAKPLAAGKGVESGERAWRSGLIASLPCLLGFSALQGKKIQRSLPSCQKCTSGARPRVTRWQEAMQPWFEAAALAPGLPPSHDTENGHSRCFTPLRQFIKWPRQALSQSGVRVLEVKMT